MDGLNEYRRARVAQVLSDFRILQYYIANAPSVPPNNDDYNTRGWAALRQCAIDGQHILDCAADVTVPQTNGDEEEQAKAELRQVLLDAFARRHESQKIYLRQAAAQRWVELREQVLQGQRPTSAHQRQLRGCDESLRYDLGQITDDQIYEQLRNADVNLGAWTGEDPSLRAVQRWLRARPQ